jgi:hypothetical protein
MDEHGTFFCFSLHGRLEKLGWRDGDGSKGEMCPLIRLETRSRGICKYINYLQQGMNDTTFPPRRKTMSNRHSFT